MYYKNQSHKGTYLGKQGVDYTGLRIVVKYPVARWSFFWQVLSIIRFGERFREYQLQDSNQNILCTCQVIRPVVFFPFIPNKNRSYQIGPCKTPSEYRGNGYYPFLLSYILNQDVTDTYDYYMIINEDNIKSIKGVLKAGFEVWGIGFKRHGRYLLSKVY